MPDEHIRDPETIGEGEVTIPESRVIITIKQIRFDKETTKRWTTVRNTPHPETGKPFGYLWNEDDVVRRERDIFLQDVPAEGFDLTAVIRAINNLA